MAQAERAPIRHLIRCKCGEWLDTDGDRVHLCKRAGEGTNNA